MSSCATSTDRPGAMGLAARESASLRIADALLRVIRRSRISGRLAALEAGGDGGRAERQHQDEDGGKIRWDPR